MDLNKRQTCLKEGKLNLKPVVLSLDIDLVLHPAHSRRVGDIYITSNKISLVRKEFHINEFDHKLQC